MIPSSVYQRILNYIDLIHRKPRPGSGYFYFDEGKKFIIDGNKLKLIPTEFNHLLKKDEFYVHIDPVCKKIMYYAYDIEDYYSGQHTNEEEGFIDWDKFEDPIYNFLAYNIKELTESITPYHDVSEPNKTTQPTTSAHNTPTHTQHNHFGSHYSSAYQPSPFSYGTDAYKAREAFYDRLWDLLKGNKTSIAMDHIKAHFSKMFNEKKFEELDYLLKIIPFDKLNTMTMLGMLDATKEFSDNLKERQDFFNRVKTHITKLKPGRVEFVLKGLGTVAKETKQLSS